MLLNADSIFRSFRTLINTMRVAFRSCIAFNASYEDLTTAVEGVTNSSVLVARERITDPGYGYRYWVSDGSLDQSIRYFGIIRARPKVAYIMTQTGRCGCGSPFIECPGRYWSNFDKSKSNARNKNIP